MLTRPCPMGRELWTNLGDSVAFHSRFQTKHCQTAKHVVSDGPEYRTEIKGINSSKLQSDILLHKRIHIYGQYSFSSIIFASDMRRNLDLLSVLFTVTRKNLTEKITALVPGDWTCWKGSVVIGRSYRCHFINIALQSIWDRGRI